MVPEPWKQFPVTLKFRTIWRERSVAGWVFQKSASQTGFSLMHIRAIEHVQLAMPAGQEETARRFYTGLLEIPEVPKPPELAKRGGVWFESGQVKVHLGVEADFRPARKAHAGLLIRNLAELLQKLRAAGVEVTEAEPLPGYNHVYVADPFGNRIELMEPSDHSEN
jgi:catechol 2,3-dioxygenase-like lactoylglutathione lyase family enzyme